MARVLLTISIFIYLVFSNGWVLDVHYCMNKVSSVHLFETKFEQCSTCGMSANESDGCCHDEEQIVKLVQDQRPAVTQDYILEAPTAIEAECTDFFKLAIRVQTQKVFQVLYDPPRVLSEEIYLRNRVFRI
ncbi:MAG: HYC_CC_PP family protein [Chitinophagaceae bacterium]|jgi:hypothetical protein